MEKGVKFDTGKPRMDLIPPSLLFAVAAILEFGARKYAPRNWEKGLAWGDVYSALQRHLNAWWNGETIDPETGKSHLWHAACNIAFLIEYERTHPELDNRPNKNAVPKDGDVELLPDLFVKQQGY